MCEGGDVHRSHFWLSEFRSKVHHHEFARRALVLWVWLVLQLHGQSAHLLILSLDVGGVLFGRDARCGWQEEVLIVRPNASTRMLGADTTCDCRWSRRSSSVTAVATMAGAQTGVGHPAKLVVVPELAGMVFILAEDD